jgi:pimeloyl-ACP methyl ester carboxylesterase
MPYLTVGKENSGNIDLYYEDHGIGKPVVLIHGWPLSGRSWEKQLIPLLDAGHRVITYDRRGFGESSKPTVGYEYDTLAADLRTLLTQLDLHDATIVGFSMGGGEVARYLGKYGPDRVAQAAFFGAIPPFLLKTADNPGGIDGSVFAGIKQGIAADRLAFLSQFLNNFFNVDVLGSKGEKRISDEFVRACWNVASSASPRGTLACVDAWQTDFRKDLSRISIPTLVLHGDDDRILPIDVTGKPMHASIKGSQLVTIKGGPHGLTWTHHEEVNNALLAFLG